jgi:hypothetical protein
MRENTELIKSEIKKVMPQQISTKFRGQLGNILKPYISIKSRRKEYSSSLKFIRKINQEDIIHLN